MTLCPFLFALMMMIMTRPGCIIMSRLGILGQYPRHKRRIPVYLHEVFPHPVARKEAICIDDVLAERRTVSQVRERVADHVRVGQRIIGLTFHMHV